MRITSFVFAAALAATSTAFAADLPVKAPGAIPVAATWTGLYWGLNAGYGWASLDDFTGSDTATGFAGGGQVGYNWQFNNVVVGVEGDFQGTSQSLTQSATVGGIAFSATEKLPWFATIRGRIGFAQGPWLIYATGGAAWVDGRVSFTALGQTVASETAKTGWTGGGGVEWMFAPKWSVKVEYLYIDAGNMTVTLAGVPLTSNVKESVARAGVNLHF